jgi:hypothetical protein
MKGEIKDYSMNGGSLLKIMVGHTLTNAIYLPNDPHYDTSAIKY